jgi:hypothetical protein
MVEETVEATMGVCIGQITSTPSLDTTLLVTIQPSWFLDGLCTLDTNSRNKSQAARSHHPQTASSSGPWTIVDTLWNHSQSMGLRLSNGYSRKQSQAVRCAGRGWRVHRVHLSLASWQRRYSAKDESADRQPMLGKKPRCSSQGPAVIETHERPSWSRSVRSDQVRTGRAGVRFQGATSSSQLFIRKPLSLMAGGFAWCRQSSSRRGSYEGEGRAPHQSRATTRTSELPRQRPKMGHDLPSRAGWESERLVWLGVNPHLWLDLNACWEISECEERETQRCKWWRWGTWVVTFSSMEAPESWISSEILV